MDAAPASRGTIGRAAAHGNVFRPSLRGESGHRFGPLALLLLLILLFVPSPSRSAPAAADGTGSGGGGEAEPLLASLAAAGWRVTGDVRRFTPENLYEEIDGEAELFLPYGFRSLAVAILASPSHPGAELRLESFFHDGAKDAFGIFSQHRYEGQETASVADGEAAVSDTSADFFRGSCFVRLRVAAGNIPRAALLEAARAAASGMPGSSSPPEAARVLSVPGVVPGTLIFQRRALSGYEALAPGFEARIAGAGGVEGKILFLEGPPEELSKRLSALPGFRRVSEYQPDVTDEKHLRRVAEDCPGVTDENRLRPAEKGSASREEWRADLSPGTLYLRRRPGGLAGVITRSPPEAVGAVLELLAPDM